MLLPDTNQMRGMTALARSFQARTLSLQGRARAGTFARAGKTLNEARTAARVKAPGGKRFLGRLVRPAATVRFRKVSNEKTRGRFPGAG
jgi:hypothetical protein